MIRLRRIHSRCAVVVALPFLWLLLSGIILWMLLFWRESLHPYALSTKQHSVLTERLQWQSIKGSLNGLESQITRVTFGDSRQSLRVNLASGDVWYWVPGESEPFHKSNPTFSDQCICILSGLHRGKFFGAVGRYAFTFFGFSILAYLFTGIALLKQRAGKQTQRRMHRILGWSVMLPLLGLILSGSLLNVASELRSIPSLPNRIAVSSQSYADWDSALLLARERHARSRISLIAKVGDSLLTEFANGRRLYSAGKTALADKAPWTRAGWIEAAYPLHSGRYWGLAGRFIILVAAVGSTMLLITGFRLRR